MVVLRADGPRPWTNHGIVEVQPTNATDKCMSSTVLRDVLTLFQNGGGFDIFILKVLQNTSLFKVHLVT
jgi:hypothetical protein